MKAKILTSFLIGVFMVPWTFLWSFPETDPASLKLKVAPPEIAIGTFFAGQEVRLSAAAAEDLDVVFEVFGPQENAMFNLKGRVGPIWMNRDSVELENAPFLYLLLLPEAGEWTNELGEAGIGFESMKRSITVRPDSLDRDMIFGEFMKLKKAEELYGQFQGAVRRSPADSGLSHFQATFFLPSATKPGVYEVVASALHDGVGVVQERVEFRVQEGGLVKTIHDLAFDHGLVYGILCVLIALVFGGLMGLFFRRSGGAH